MRILRCIATSNPAQGGPWSALLASAAEHAKAGHTTEVLTFDRADDPWVTGAPLIVHPTGPALFGNKFAPGYVRWLRKHADAYDGIVLHGLWNFTSIGAWLALAGRQVPYVVYLHGSLDPWFRHHATLKGRLKALHLRGLEGKVLRDAACVMFTSEDEMARARDAYAVPPFTGRVVAYGVGAPPAPTPRQADALRAAIPKLGSRRFLLFLGRIDAKKGCDLAIEGFAKAATNQDIDLVIAGPDQAGLLPEMKALAARLGCSGRIHWPGPLAGDAKWGAFHSAEAFVLVSHTENFGIAVAEALAASCPVLISNKVGIWREVEAAGAGLVADDSAAGAEELIDRFLRLTLPDVQSMRAHARQLHGENFNAAAAAADLLDVLEKAARTRAVRGSR